MEKFDKWSEVTPEQVKIAAADVEGSDLGDVPIHLGAAPRHDDNPKEVIVAETVFGIRNTGSIHNEANITALAEKNPHEGLADDVMNFNRPF